MRLNILIIGLLFVMLFSVGFVSGVELPACGNNFVGSSYNLGGGDCIGVSTVCMSGDTDNCEDSFAFCDGNYYFCSGKPSDDVCLSNNEVCEYQRPECGMHYLGSANSQPDAHTLCGDQTIGNCETSSFSYTGASDSISGIISGERYNCKVFNSPQGSVCQAPTESWDVYRCDVTASCEKPGILPECNYESSMAFCSYINRLEISNAERKRKCNEEPAFKCEGNDFSNKCKWNGAECIGEVSINNPNYPLCPESCTNRIDDNGDGLIDCMDEVTCEGKRCNQESENCGACVRTSNLGEAYVGECTESGYPVPEDYKKVCCDTYDENDEHLWWIWEEEESCQDVEFFGRTSVIVDDSICTENIGPYNHNSFGKIQSLPNVEPILPYYYQDFSTRVKLLGDISDLHNPPSDELRTETLAENLKCKYLLKNPPRLLGEKGCSESFGWWTLYEIEDMPFYETVEVTIKDDGSVVGDVCKDDVSSKKEFKVDSRIKICPSIAGPFSGSSHSLLKLSTQRNFCEFEVENSYGAMIQSSKIRAPKIFCEDDIVCKNIEVNTPGGVLKYDGACEAEQKFCVFEGHPEINNIECNPGWFNPGGDKDCKNVEIGGEIYNGLCQDVRKFCEFEVKKESYLVNVPCYNEGSIEDCQGIEVEGQTYNGICKKGGFFNPYDVFPQEEDVIVDFVLNVGEDYYSPVNDPLYGPQNLEFEITIRGYASHILGPENTESGRKFISPVPRIREDVLDKMSEIVSSTRTGDNRMFNKEEFENILKENIESISGGSSVYGLIFSSGNQEMIVERSAIVVDKITFTITPDLKISVLEEIDITQVKSRDSNPAVRDDKEGIIPRTVTTVGPYVAEGDLYESLSFFKRVAYDSVKLFLEQTRIMFAKIIIPDVINKLRNSEDLSSLPVEEIKKEPPLYGKLIVDKKIQVEIGNLELYNQLNSCNYFPKEVSSKSTFYVVKDLDEERLEGVGYEIQSDKDALKDMIKRFNDLEIDSRDVLLLDLSTVGEECETVILEEDNFNIDVGGEYDLTSSDGYVNIEIPLGAFEESANVLIQKIDIKNCDRSLRDMALETDFSFDFPAQDYYDENIENFESVFEFFHESEIMDLNVEKWINSEISVEEIFSVF